MLRRVARVARILLLVLGVVLVLWLAVSFFCLVQMTTAWSTGGVGMVSGDGAIEVWLVRQPSEFIVSESQFDFRWGYNDGFWNTLSSATWPGFDRTPPGTDYFGVEASLPIWLLAVVCLAWPVTSFIVQRRKRRRGFLVEPKGDQGSVVGSQGQSAASNS